MGGIRNSGAFVLLLASVSTTGCQTTSRVDLAYNRSVYDSPRYEAPRSTDAPVFVQRMKDGRTPTRLSEEDSIKSMFPDSDWDRKIPLMVEDVLIDEIDRSGIYTSISSGSAGVPRNGDYVIQPTLRAFYRYKETLLNTEAFVKRRSCAYGALHIRVLSPMDASGKREILLDKVFHDLVVDKPTRMRAQRGILLAGRALQNIMGQVMPGLYESNIRAIPGAPVRK